MCPCGQATIGTVGTPDQTDGSSRKEDRWEPAWQTIVVSGAVARWFIRHGLAEHPATKVGRRPLGQPGWKGGPEHKQA
jgi:hypothetical protein